LERCALLSAPARSYGVVLDPLYEARDIDQSITSQAKIDQWFEAKTRGQTPLADRWPVDDFLASHNRDGRY
jgi:hypothetical protein